jgi:hypothetical protein
MIRYSFFIIISMCSLVYSVPKSCDNYRDLGPYIISFKKRSETLSLYLELMRKYKGHKHFESYETDFLELEVKASRLLQNNKKLSFLSMDHLSGNTQSFYEMREILTQDLDVLHEITGRVEKILSEINVVLDKIFEGQKPLCESYTKLHKIYQKTIRCIDSKNYPCVHESLDEASQERCKYEQCIDNILREKNLLRKWEY